VLPTVESHAVLRAAAQLVLGLVEPAGHPQRQAQVEPVRQVVLAQLRVVGGRGGRLAVALDRAADLVGVQQHVAEVALGRCPGLAAVAVLRRDRLQFARHEFFGLGQMALLQQGEGRLDRGGR
jgi:hypothetical protein